MSRPTYKFTKEELLDFLGDLRTDTDFRIKHDKIEIWDGERYTVMRSLKRA